MRELVLLALTVVLLLVAYSVAGQVDQFDALTPTQQREVVARW